MLTQRGWNIKLGEGELIGIDALFCDTGFNKLAGPPRDGANILALRMALRSMEKMMA